MSGAPDPVYVRARRVLLDALEALGEQRRALVLVGAQAVYLRVGEADFAVSPYTEDADLALIPELLLDLPVLAEALAAANFTSDQPGIWKGANGGTVDLLVPEALGGSGRRGARLGSPHGDVYSELLQERNDRAREAAQELLETRIHPRWART